MWYKCLGTGLGLPFNVALHWDDHAHKISTMTGTGIQHKNEEKHQRSLCFVKQTLEPLGRGRDLSEAVDAYRPSKNASSIEELPLGTYSSPAKLVQTV